MAKRARTVKLYDSYRFINKDPIIDAIRTARKDTGMTYQDVRDKSGVTVSTLKKWEVGDTKRPQFPTVAAATLGMGYTGIKFTGGKPKLVR